MKKIFYLMSVALAFATISCEKPENGDGGNTEPVEGTVPATATAGSAITVGGTFVATDEFYLLEEKDNQENRIDLVTDKTLESGVMLKLPYYTGKYYLYVDRDSKANYLGEITVEVTGVSVPYAGAIGKTISISGNGLNPKGKLYLQPAEGDAIDLKSTYADCIATATIPATTAKGTYSLYYEQEKGFNYTISEAFPVAKQKRMLSFTEEMQMDMSGAGDMITVMSTSYVFDENQFIITLGMLNEETFEFEEMPIMGFAFEESESGYVFSDLFEMGMDFTLNIKNGRVLNAVYGDSKEWEYNEDGYLTIAYAQEDTEFLYDDSENYAGSNSVFENKELINTPFAIDIAVLSNLSMSFEGDPIIASALMLGYGGKPSVNYPSDGIIERDTDEYITKYTVDQTAEAGMMVVYNYTYEE